MLVYGITNPVKSTGSALDAMKINFGTVTLPDVDKQQAPFRHPLEVKSKIGFDFIYLTPRH